MPQQVEIVERRRVHDGFFKFDLLRLRHELFRGGLSDVLRRELFLQHHAVSVLPYDPLCDMVVLIEQFRTGAIEAPDGPWTIEGVAGMLDPGERPEEACAREVREECGLELGRLELASFYMASPGATTERVHAYVGEVTAPEHGGIHGLALEHEDIRVGVYTYEDAVGMLRSGRIIGANTVIPLQHLMLNRDRLRLAWRPAPG